MGRGLGGRERGTGSCGLPAVPTRSQPNGRYRLTPRANPAHGRPSPLLTRPGQVHGRHCHCPYASMAGGRDQNSRTDWGRPRPRSRPPSSDLLDHGCSSHGTSHSRHQPLLLTDPVILILVLVLDHFCSRPWPWPSAPAPPSRLSPPTIVLACSRTRPRRLLASTPSLRRLFLAAIQRDEEAEKDSERQGRMLKKNNRQTNHPPSTSRELKIGGVHGHGHLHRSPVRKFVVVVFAVLSTPAGMR